MRESGLLATCLPIIMPAVVVVVVSQETTLHKFKLQSFPPFLPPPLPISFLFFSFFLFWVGGGGKGGGSKPPPLSPRKGGVGDEVSPTPLLVLVLKNKKI